MSRCLGEDVEVAVGRRFRGRRRGRISKISSKFVVGRRAGVQRFAYLGGSGKAKTRLNRPARKESLYQSNMRNLWSRNFIEICWRIKRIALFLTRQAYLKY